jgi:D-sedoheptulose 7-phosphate isomerase
MTNPDPARFARDYLQQLIRVIEDLALDELARGMTLIERAMDQDRQIFLAGNGGSAATANHMANDLLKAGATSQRGRARAISLSANISVVTALANDDGYAQIFALQLAAQAMAGDLLVVITGSGNSPNILRALDVARELGVQSLGFLGMGGGKAKSLVDCAVIVPSEAYGPIEDLHLVFDHLIAAYLLSRPSRAERTAR